MTLEEKLQLIRGESVDEYRGNQAGFVRGIKRLGIPDFFICDGESGVDTSWDATALPAKVGLAATFDENAAYEYGLTLGKEAKSCGMNLLLTPRVNIVRDSVTTSNMANGGNYQTYSEDPLLNGKMGAAEARGIQTDNNAIANAKQLFGASTGTAQGAGNCIIDEQTMHEIYLKPFEAVIRAGVGSNMTNYNQVNGVWTYKFFDVMQKLCRDAWGFDGVTICDWFCLYEPEAIMGGVTLEMPGVFGMYGEKLIEALEDKENPVQIDHIDRAVRYYLTMLERFEVLGTQRTPGPLSQERKQEGYRVARDIARRTAVLLKNDGILPINPSKGSIAIIGATGGQQVMPIFKEAAYGFAERRIGPADAFRAETDIDITYAVGEELEGTLVPLENTIDAEGKPGGLTLELVAFNSRLAMKNLEAAISPLKNLGRQESVEFKLPMPQDPDNVYMWTGKIKAPETGLYRLGMHMSMPDVEVFEKNNIQSSDMAVFTSGDLYFNGKRVNEGIRTAMNGGNCPHSEVLPCRDGFNNVGGYVEMEAGTEYELMAFARSMYKEPVEARLCWVTPSMAKENLNQAVEAAKSADIAVVFAWHKTSHTLNLPGGQENLISKIAEANPNTVVVLNNGDPVIMPWANKVKGILEMWYPGQEGALATVDVLCGRYNPAGRLPLTFPKKLEDTPCHEPGHPERFAEPGREHDKDWIAPNVAHFTEGINMGYRHFDAKGIEPAYEFGFGLSYTQFEYSDMSIEQKNDGITLRCKITNTGKQDGEEVVQCYLSRPDTIPEGVQASPQALADFKRVAIKAGQSVYVELIIPQQSLCYWKCGHGWEPLRGKRDICIGASSRDIRLRQAITV